MRNSLADQFAEHCLQQEKRAFDLKNFKLEDLSRYWNDLNPQGKAIVGALGVGGAGALSGLFSKDPGAGARRGLAGAAIGAGLGYFSPQLQGLYDQYARPVVSQAQEQIQQTFR